MSDEICPICGGKKRIAYTIVLQECVPHEIRVEPHQEGFLCPGHQRPKQQHDGKLGANDYIVYHDEKTFTRSPVVRIEGKDAAGAGGEDVVSLSPQEALSLFTWLLQEKETLERLVKEQASEGQ